MKKYVGRRFEPGSVNVSVIDGVKRNLVHREKHSPDGFEWGYGGSGPSDLARSILWDHLGKEPPPVLYQDFKFAFVAKFEDEWVLTSEEIDSWLREK